MAELLVLRLVHILGGLFWVGSGLFMFFYLGPALKEAGPLAAGAVMASMQKRRFFQLVPIVAVLTMLAGLRLMWIVSLGQAHWFVHRPGHMYSVSGALAIVAFLVGMIVSRPAMVRVGKLAQSAASDGASKDLIAHEMAALQKRAQMSSGVAVALLVLSAAGMAVARYL